MEEEKKKTKDIPCSVCGKLVTVHIFANNTQQCDEHKSKGTSSIVNNTINNDKINQFLKIELTEADTTSLKLRAIARGEHALNENDDFSKSLKERIYVYCIGIGYRLSKNSVLYKQYNGRMVSIVFNGRDFVGFILKEYSVDHGRLVNELISGIEAFNKIKSKEIKDDLSPVVAVAGGFDGVCTPT